MFTLILLGLLHAASPAAAAPAKPAAKATAKTPEKAASPAKALEKADKAPDAPPAKPDAKAAAEKPVDAAPMDPDVKKVVDAMQAFYEKTNDFEAHFEQAYTYTSSHRTQKSSGKMLFKKPALMRWDYEKPGEKTIVLAGNFVYMYDAEAQTFTKAPLQADRLSASVTFLWGKGRLADEFNITRSKRTDMGEGTVLELIPRKADPRFDKLFFLVDPKTNAVTQTIVVDPDAAENHMTFTQVKVDQNLGLERFHIEPPPDTRPQDMTQMPAAPK